jgi:hypothetical protein
MTIYVTRSVTSYQSLIRLINWFLNQPLYHVGSFALFAFDSYLVAAQPSLSTARQLQQSLVNQALSNSRSNSQHTAVVSDVISTALSARDRMEQAIKAEQDELMSRFAALQWIQTHRNEYERQFGTASSTVSNPTFKISDASEEVDQSSGENDEIDADEFAISQFGGVFGRGGFGRRGPINRRGRLPRGRFDRYRPFSAGRLF